MSPSLSLDLQSLGDLYSALEPTSTKGWNDTDDNEPYAYFISQGSEYSLQQPTSTAVTRLTEAQVAQAVAGIDALVQALDALPTPPTALTEALSAWAASLNTSTPVSGLKVATLITHIRNNQRDDQATLVLYYLYCPPLGGPLPVHVSLGIKWAGALTWLDDTVHLVGGANLLKTVAVLAATFLEWNPPALALLSVVAISLSVADVVVKLILEAASDGGQLNLIGVIAHAIQNITTCVGPWTAPGPQSLPQLDLDGLGYTWVSNPDSSSVIQGLSYSYKTALFPVTDSLYPSEVDYYEIGGNQLLTYGFDWSAQYPVGLPEVSWTLPAGGMLMTSKVEVSEFGSQNSYALYLMYFAPTGELLCMSVYTSSGATSSGIVAPPQESYDSSYLIFDQLPDNQCLLTGVIAGEVASFWAHSDAAVLQLMYVVPAYMSACASNVVLPPPPPAPVITWVRPPTLRQGDVASVVLFGTFAPGATCDFGPGITQGPSPINLGSTIQVVLTVAEDAPTGPHTVTVTNPGTGGYLGGTTTTFDGGLWVKDPDAALRPHIASLSPDSGSPGASLTVEISGSGFASGATCDFGPTIQVTASTTVNDGLIRAAIAIPESTTPGPTSVQVTNPHQAKHPATASFTVLGLPLEVHDVSPHFGGPGQQLDLRVSGANFQLGAVCAFPSGSGIEVDACTNVAGHESRLLAVTVRIAQDAEVGFLPSGQDLTVTNPDTQSVTQPDAFFLRRSSALVVQEVRPRSGKPGEQLTLTVSGYGFSPSVRCGFARVDPLTGQPGPSGITVDSCVASSASLLTLEISIAPDASAELCVLLVVEASPKHRLGVGEFFVERA